MPGSSVSEVTQLSMSASSHTCCMRHQFRPPKGSRRNTCPGTAIRMGSNVASLICQALLLPLLLLLLPGAHAAVDAAGQPLGKAPLPAPATACHAYHGLSCFISSCLPP